MMGRTNIVLDEKLLRQAMRLSKSKTKKEAVDTALKEYVAHRKQREILKLYGSGTIDPAYDYKASRR